MKELFSIFLAFQVLLSSMSFNIGMHFCGESLKSLSIFDKAVPCKHHQALQHEAMPECPLHPQSEQTSEDDCCNDKQVKVEGQDIDTTFNSFNFDLSPQLEFVAAYAAALLNLYSESNHSSRFLNYKPPLIKTDIPVFIQTFLI